MHVDTYSTAILSGPCLIHTPEASSSSSGPGCLDDLKKAWKEGKFKTYARWGGVLNVIVAIFLCFLLLAYVRHHLAPLQQL